ncbi:hypothetical protein UY3_03941 [Chelonia mydas]|uniref:Uncharacterized protein n=1 Tax=Chelonia mydas TaxID=8469 RepID=M7CDI1_CHEMY|nr:hypothetical protein UY3_03941 [Chelonia mydas]
MVQDAVKKNHPGEKGALYLIHGSRTISGIEEAVSTDVSTDNGTGKTAGSSETLGPDAAHGAEALFTQILGTEKAICTVPSPN